MQTLLIFSVDDGSDVMYAQIQTSTEGEGSNDSESFKEWMERHDFAMDDETYSILSKTGFRTMYEIYNYVLP